MEKKGTFSARNLIFVNGTSDGGGSIFSEGEIESLIDCVFRNNTALGITNENGGGAVLVGQESGSKSTHSKLGSVQGCLFEGNKAYKRGGGALSVKDSPSMVLVSQIQRFSGMLQIMEVQLTLDIPWGLV